MRMYFQVKYAPKVVIRIVEGALDTGRIPVDNSIRLRCNADAHPNELTYQWYINDEMIIDATFSELVTTTLYHEKLLKLGQQKILHPQKLYISLSRNGVFFILHEHNNRVNFHSKDPFSFCRKYRA